MIQAIDLTGIVKQSSDLVALRAYVQQLVGQPFLHFRFSYGDELTVHLGEPQEYVSPKMQHLTKGSYIICARGSQWFLKSLEKAEVLVGAKEGNSKVDLGSLTKKLDCELAAAQVANVDVLAIETPANNNIAYGLSLTFSNETVFSIHPTSHESDDIIADWEVFTPHGRYLRVGPGCIWSYIESRQ